MTTKPSEARKLNSEVKKLELEARKIEFELSSGYERRENLKAWGAFGTTIAAIAAILTIILSSYSFLASQQAAQLSKTSEEFQNIMTGLAADSRTRRVTAISSLLSISSNNELSSKALFALTSILPVESDQLVRASVLDGLRSLLTLSPAIKKDDLNSSLRRLLAASREMLQEFAADRATQNSAMLQDDAVRYSLAVVKRLPDHASSIASVGLGIEALLRSGARITNMSGIYCFECDFSKLDLSYADFRRSVLSQSSFSQSHLQNSNFKDAIIYGVNFNSSDLSFSDISASSEESGEEHVNYILSKITSNENLGEREWPTFRCAILHGADFSNRTIMLVTPAKTKSLALEFYIRSRAKLYVANGFDFSQADLSQAKLSKISVVSLHGKDDYIVSKSLGSLSGSGKEDIDATRYEGVEFKPKTIVVDPLFEGAKMPVNLPSWFEALINVSRNSEGRVPKPSCQASK